MLFRGQNHARISSIGYAESSGGRQFDILPQPVLSPEAPYERGGGVEDPRLVEIAGVYYLTYTGYDGHSAQLCLAVSSDLKHWERRGVILPAYKGTWNKQWTKSGAIVPEKIAGKWWMYYLGTAPGPDGRTRDQMGLASSPDLLHWTDATDRPVMSVRLGAFDSRVMEPGPPPIVTPAGILLLYNGADDKLVYRPAWVLFDARNPAHVLARADHPFAAPQLDWEKTGTVVNVIFLEGAIPEPFSPLEFLGFYGAADRYIGAMRIHISLGANAR